MKYKYVSNVIDNLKRLLTNCLKYAVDEEKLIKKII